jgi:hypothetical protein
VQWHLPQQLKNLRVTLPVGVILNTTTTRESGYCCLWRYPMYGLTDDIVSYREDIEYLQEVIKTLLAYAPMDVRKAYVAALKAKQLLPKGVKTK